MSDSGDKAPDKARELDEQWEHYMTNPTPSNTDVEIDKILRGFVRWGFDKTGEPAMYADIPKAKAALLALGTKQNTIMFSDLAWCLGNLRSLGHPNERLEKLYGFQGKGGEGL